MGKTKHVEVKVSVTDTDNNNELTEKELVKRKSSKEDLEKKREKNRINKLRRRQIKRGKIDIPTKGQNEAVDYLKYWNEDKDNWKFMKVRQTWLLKNMFRASKISNEDFEILVQYISELKGNARIKSREQAECLVKEIDYKWSRSSEKDDCDVQIYDRARKVVESL